MKVQMDQLVQEAICFIADSLEEVAAIHSDLAALPLELFVQLAKVSAHMQAGMTGMGCTLQEPVSAGR